ncbi:pantetheine-phosphate adenylyltransferase [Ichthyobacterium seriolicida]|uniref:Phosphopantetheine adenylyltransferase n=1 Tax=Ichthyobacterium seriolicida TaxID=242600 RepID=A0A1J1EBY5_9FLAO|nr:pantetheine-phosphate adenylyltransferase [Ichthyobacterium seriolicida]BAV95024.1 phosphopantetheine adenylyltransferase [Ichthyobacterium seriolicida]
MSKIAVFPGSFDPITNGHLSIVKRALPIFDQIIIAIGENNTKKYMFSLEDRLYFVKKTFENEPKVIVDNYRDLTVDFCKKRGALFILRGLRNPSDFEFEKAIAHTNNKLCPEIETVFLLTHHQYSFISSSIVRDIIKNKGNYSDFVPDVVPQFKL